MNQLSTLSLLMGKPAKFYEDKCTPYEAGLRGGAVLHERKLKRLEEMRPKMLEMLRKRSTYSEMAQEFGLSKMAICKYVKDDPEFNQLASLYVKRGGYRKRKSG